MHLLILVLLGLGSAVVGLIVAATTGRFIAVVAYPVLAFTVRHALITGYLTWWGLLFIVAALIVVCAFLTHRGNRVWPG